MADEKALPPGEGDANQENLPAAASQQPDETLEVQAPNIGEQSETTRLERRKKLSLRQDATGEVPAPAETVATPAPSETQSTVLQDPTKRRDTNTASLKRLRPQDLAAPSDDNIVEDDPDNTETVNIKVIKEQKKQFRNMMTSSQTLKVNPDGTPSEQDAPAPGETLKVQAGETRTESISRPSAPPPAETAAPSSTASPKSTLKIKAPPGVAPAQGGSSKPGATLKIKAPAPAGGEEAAGPDPSARTVKQTVAKRPGKTLKLRQGAPQQRPAATTSTAARQQQQVMPVEDEGGSPGVFYLITSLAGLAAFGVVIWKTLESSKALFGVYF